MSQSLSHKKIAKRYVKSLFSDLTKKTEIDGIAKEIASLGNMIAASSDLQLFIKSPLISKSQQKQGLVALSKAAKFSTLVSNLLQVLADNRRLLVLPTLVVEVEAYLAKQSGTLPVSIATARKLSAADQKKIQTEIKAVLGKDILTQHYVDEGLIGGLVVQVGSTLIDGSIKTKLDKLERKLVGATAA